jgi:hypothetical protein
MGLESEIRKKRATAGGKNPIAATLQGVSKDRISEVLAIIDRDSADRRDVVFALLDDQSESFFALNRKSFPSGYKVCDGATVAHLACHVGILQRGGAKLDREGRDYWLKPLWEIGAIEKIFYDSKAREFIPGHPVAKSSNSAYRLAPDFVLILRAPENQWQAMLSEWIGSDRMRQRLELQARLAEESKARVDTKHSDLIQVSVEHYVPCFLPGYDVIFVDDADGDRIAQADIANLYRAGVEPKPDDAWPDVLLWNPESDWLWVIEAVTSDGEVDPYKVEKMTGVATRSGKAGIGFTTTYQTWKSAAARQGSHKNLAPGTYIWIQEDPSKQFLAETFEAGE